MSSGEDGKVRLFDVRSKTKCSCEGCKEVGDYGTTAAGQEGKGREGKGREGKRREEKRREEKRREKEEEGPGEEGMEDKRKEITYNGRKAP